MRGQSLVVQWILTRLPGRQNPVTQLKVRAIMLGIDNIYMLLRHPPTRT